MSRLGGDGGGVSDGGGHGASGGREGDVTRLPGGSDDRFLLPGGFATAGRAYDEWTPCRRPVSRCLDTSAAVHRQQSREPVGRPVESFRLSWSLAVITSLRDGVVGAAWMSAVVGLSVLVGARGVCADDLRDLQQQAVEQGQSAAAHWGWRPEVYSLWTSHSSRLIPVYTFGTRGAGPGIDLDSYTGANSLYRDEAKIARLYGRPPYLTHNPEADYLDQTNVFDIQKAALDAGKKHIFLVIFDGMDWDTTRAAAIYNLGDVAYDSGRGRGTHFQEYAADGTSQFSFMVTSPHNEGTDVDVDAQTLKNPGGAIPGGYDVDRGGPNPWTPGNDDQYLVTQPKDAANPHAYTDSAASAVSMTTGIKTYNNSINVDAAGQQVPTIAHLAQEEGYAVGAVSSVPISHATPAATYAHNVHRDDYQDLTRDMIGLPSISHPDHPLPGLDVAIGGGWGTDRDKDDGQGDELRARQSVSDRRRSGSGRRQERWSLCRRREDCRCVR